MAGGAGSRQRDLFPLPVEALPQVSQEDWTRLSRGCRRRVLARHGQERLLHDAVCTLNELDAGGDVSPMAPSSRPHAGQRLVLRRLAESVRRMGAPPADLSTKDALAELQVAGPYDTDHTGLRVPLIVDRLSLPASGAQPVALDSLLRCDGQQWIRDFFKNKVLPKQEAAAAKREAGFRRPYNDPILNSAPVYARLILKLLDSGVVDLTANEREVAQEVGMFAVKKKSGNQRLVVDARGSNFWFASPGHVHLPTGAALSLLELEPHESLYIADADISNAFYNMALPTELRRYFALRGVEARHLGLSHVGGQPVKPTQVVWPRMAVLPMGWSHALELCQQIHEKIVRDKEDLSPERAVVDRQRVPAFAGKAAHAEYVDNFLAFATEPGLADSLKELAVARLRAAGLPVHEETSAREGATALGWSFEGDRIAATSRRLWRLRLGTTAVMKRGRATGQQLSRLVGHFTFAGLLRRPFLSVFDAVYSFEMYHWNEETELWPSVLRELRWAASLLPLLWTDLRAEWDERVIATDASEWGRGGVQRTASASAVASAGRQQERWRFARGSDKWHMGARAHAGMEPHPSDSCPPVQTEVSNATGGPPLRQIKV